MAAADQDEAAEARPAPCATGQSPRGAPSPQGHNLEASFPPVGGRGDLQLRVGAAVRTFVRVSGHPERVRISLGELRHIAGFDQLDTAPLLVLARRF